MAYKWEVTQGRLPDGLSLVTENSGRVGFLFGKPTKIGSFSWTITVSDDDSPVPSTASQSYSMNISASLYLTGFLIDDFGLLPKLTKGVSIDNSFNFNRLTIQELGSHDSTFTISVVEGTKPAWMTIAVGATTNYSTDVGPVKRYCAAPVNFSGTPDATGTGKFTIRVTSSTTGFQDLPLTYIVQEPGDIQEVLGDLYVLSSDKTEVAEGETVRVTLTATNLQDGALVPYLLSGSGTFTAGDIDVPLTGNFTMSSIVSREPVFAGPFSDQIVAWRETKYYVGNLDITAAADVTTEGTETLRISLPTITRNEIGWKKVHEVNIRDTSVAPAVKKLESSAASVAEGGSFTITFTNSEAPQDAIFNYLISGVSSEDLYGQPLFGQFRIGYDDDNLRIPTGTPTSTKTFAIKPNGIVDTNKKFTISVASLGLSKSVSITDANPTYSLSSTSDEIREGQSVTFTLATTTVADDTQIGYSITGVSSGDVGDRLGNALPLTGTITVRNNLAALTVKAIEDAVTETGTETMVFNIPSLGLSKQVRILDTSQTPAPINYTLTLFASDGVTPIDGSTTLTEGDSFYVRIDASPDAVGSGVRYAITGLTNEVLDTSNANYLQSLSGTWTMIQRSFSILGTEIISAFYIALVKTKSDGSTTNLRTVKVSLPDIGKEASFQLKSVAGTSTPTDPKDDWMPGTPYNRNLIPSYFDWKAYINHPSNSDLLAAKIDTQIEAERHYVLYGIAEGRNIGTTAPPPPASADPVELVIAATPKGIVGVNYNYAGSPVYVSYTGGVGPLTWSISSGSLPPGMTSGSENSNTVGHQYYLGGAPTTVGSYSFQITGTDTESVSDTLSLTIVVENPPNDGGGTNPGGGGTVTGTGGELDQTLDEIMDNR